VGGNSDLLLDQALAGAQEAGAEVEKIVLSRKKISGCLDCQKCNESGVCVIKDDIRRSIKRSWKPTPFSTAYQSISGP